MKYISGIHALNLRCSLETCGDWHASGIQWKNLTVRESSDSVFGDYGIEDNSSVPEHPGKHKTANHIRALLDLVAEGAFGYAQGMKNELICNDSYTPEVFSKLLLLKDSLRWPEIRDFVGKEYGLSWLKFLKDQGCDIPATPISSESKKNLNITVPCKVDDLAVSKTIRYQGKPNLQDLCELIHIVNNFFDILSHPTKAMIREVLSYRGKDQLEYLIAMQSEPPIGEDQLIENYLKMEEKLGLLLNEEGHKNQDKISPKTRDIGI